MKQLRGINLGGWLVLERWMTPSVFEGSDAPDEYTLCQQLGDARKQRLKKHRDTFIIKADFEWIADNGFNAVRLPIGHWAFEGQDPYVACKPYIDKAMQWAAELELAVIIDLHTAPGSQNGWIHSGQSGRVGWHTDLANIQKTIEVIEEIAVTYGKHPSLWGIELLNEPSLEVPLHTLQDYYAAAYTAVRKHSDCNVIVSDAYRPIAEWEDFVKSPDRQKMLLDLHLYQTFDERDKQLSFDEHIAKTLKWKHWLDQFGAEKIIVGEWSAVLDNTYNTDTEEAKRQKALYTEAQQYAFANVVGQFYWSYKTENYNDWSYRNLS